MAQRPSSRRRSAAKPKTLPRAVRPNLGIEAAYRAALDRWIAAMNKSVLYWVQAKFRANEPAILAVDELPATVMQREVRRLARRWQRNFNEAAPKLADFFSQEIGERSDQSLQRILRDGGFSVKFKMTRAQRDIIKATTNQNVALIRSIPEQYLKNIEGAVMRSIQSGRDLHQLTEDILKTHTVTRRRAELIARDQNNKATASMHKARLTELGLTEAIWMHSGGGKEPRPTHKAAGKRGQHFDVREGWFDPDPKVQKHIQPGELINCRCVCKAVVPGF